jgi:hypothetical protein
LVPWHPGDQHRHSARVGDAGEHEPAPDEAGEPHADPLPERIGAERRERGAGRNERAGTDSHLTLERHRLPAAHHGDPGRFAGRRPALDAHDVADPRLQHLLAGLLAAAARLADEVDGALPRPDHDLLGVEPVERHVVGEFDVHLAELGGRADVDQGDALAAASQVRQCGRGDRGDHGRPP